MFKYASPSGQPQLDFKISASEMEAKFQAFIVTGQVQSILGLLQSNYILHYFHLLTSQWYDPV